MLAPKVRDANMRLGYFLAGLAAVLAAFLLAGQPPLLPAEFGQGVLQDTGGWAPARRSDVVRNELRPTSIPTADSVFGLIVDVAQIAGEDDVPLAGLSLEGDGLDLALDRAMQFDPDHPDVLDPEPFAVQADAVTVGGELDRVEVIPALESG